MKLSRTELNVLLHIAKGENSINKIAKALRKSEAQIYKALNYLRRKDIVEYKEKSVTPKQNTHTILLLQNLLKHPNLIHILSDSGIDMFKSMLKPKNILEIIEETELKKSFIYKKIKEGEKISLIKKENKKISINEKIWPDIQELLDEIKKYEYAVDSRVPANSIIHFKTKKEIVFSNPGEIDAALTAFSAYEDYRIKLLLPTNYYYLPKKKLSLKEVFIHSLKITEKDTSIRNLIFVSLFYLKYRRKFTRIENEIINNIEKILKGETVQGYPRLSEIKERAEIYDIKI